MTITLRTDGRSSYVVYFGRRFVFRSNRLKLNVKPPLRAYLEVEAQGIPFQAWSRDFWVVADNEVIVDGLRDGDRVTLAPAGRSPVRALANAAGQAQLMLPLTDARGTGTITVDGNDTHRSFTGMQFAGGDVYKLGA